ncbi:3-oxoacyl-[acyl-carrier-protein] synthase-3 [Nonomuraea solani]|uniref:3-oxoacyl-[acyl-carrier-protein] synthase-3 n=1 Tax=Nonomuraea solani TaxID=1144553 RepID=A0A1H5Y7S8_9ACTN|nr:beta-ketoacyl-ACP synthase III [Nonomuraea solani]SEG19640.1 3-oxoacyl-[acyl-carrier-protein] synthase-3 [Nonomuraea solani]
MTTPSHRAPGHITAGSRIIALGHYQPTEVLGNEEVGERAGVQPEWIAKRTGIRQRHVSPSEETVTDMAVKAAEHALASTDDATDIDTLIVATSTAASTIPSTAAQVASELGLANPAAFDLNTACSGFCYALACADALIRSGTSRKVLVIAADQSTSWLDWNDRETAILFGDGAGAALVAPSTTPDIGPVVWGSMGEKADAIEINADDQFIHQKGRAVFRWASDLGTVAREICEAAGVAPERLAAFVPHQANTRIIDALAEDLGVPPGKVAKDVTHSGNTIAASIPLALSRMAADNDLPTDEPILLFGFGAGLAYAGQIVTLRAS